LDFISNIHLNYIKIYIPSWHYYYNFSNCPDKRGKKWLDYYHKKTNNDTDEDDYQINLSWKGNMELDLRRPTQCDRNNEIEDEEGYQLSFLGQIFPTKVLFMRN
jgi:hypothetical protein